jgi:hypothetical protein
MLVEFQIKGRRCNLSRELQGSRRRTQSPEKSGSSRYLLKTLKLFSAFHRKGFEGLSTHPQAVQQYGQLSRNSDNRSFGGSRGTAL